MPKATMKPCWILLIFILLISGCASSPRLVSPKQLGPKKVILIKAGDATGEESMRLSEIFQEVSQLNVVLTPDKYISSLKLNGQIIPKETLADLYKEDIAVVILLQDMSLNHAHIVSGPDEYKLGDYSEIDIYDDKGYLKTFRGNESSGGKKTVRYWWHWIMGEVAGNFVVYDTESASQIYAERYPKKSKLASFSFSDQGGWIQTSRAAKGLSVFANADWKGRFLSPQKNENNTAIKEGMRVAGDEAVKRYLTYIAKLKK